MAIRILIVGTLLAASCAGQLCRLPEVNINSPKDLTGSFVISLGIAKEARDVASNPKPPTQEMSREEMALDLMYTAKSARVLYECALRSIGRFDKSTNPDISAVAVQTAKVYKALAENQVRLEQQIKKMASGQASPAEMGVLVDRLAELKVAADNSWSTLLQSPMLVIRATVAPSSTSKEPARWLLALADRNRLQLDLVRVFGASVRDGFRVGQDRLLATAALLYELLSVEPE